LIFEYFSAFLDNESLPNAKTANVFPFGDPFLTVLREFNRFLPISISKIE